MTQKPTGEFMFQEKVDYASIPDAELYDAVMSELDWHEKADNFTQGQYWENGKGCAVGCLLKSDNHIEYESAFGIPVVLARLEDRLFEGLTKEQSKSWPKRFMGAVLSAGGNRALRMEKLSTTGWKFLYWLLTEELPTSVAGEGEIFENVRKAIAKCADIILPLTKGEKINKAAARAAAAGASRAAYAAAGASRAADAAAYAAAYAADAADAAYAAYAADADAADAAYAAYAAYAAASRAGAAAGAGAGAYQRMADKLIELIEAEKAGAV